MCNPIDIPLNLRTCFSCPHCNKEDSKWNADISDYMTYCLKKREYCIENTDDPICAEREEELRHRFNTLDNIFVPYYDLSLKWLLAHGFKREKEEISPDLETYCYTLSRSSNNQSPVIVSPRYVISAGIWEVKVTCGNDDFYSSGNVDVRDCMMDILPRLNDLLG